MLATDSDKYIVNVNLSSEVIFIQLKRSSATSDHSRGVLSDRFLLLLFVFFTSVATRFSDLIIDVCEVLSKAPSIWMEAQRANCRERSFYCRFDKQAVLCEAISLIDIHFLRLDRWFYFLFSRETIRTNRAQDFGWSLFDMIATTGFLLAVGK